ncbi:MAG: hypothetical protein M1269_08830 [Chloroflexi bacterium]|nr:hypothetical protein [Chloroflexota bacterium]
MMKKLFFLAILMLVLIGTGLKPALSETKADIKEQINALDSLKTDIAKEQKIQRDLATNKDLLIKLDATIKEEESNLANSLSELNAECDEFASEAEVFNNAVTKHKAEDADLVNKVLSAKPVFEQHQADEEQLKASIERHNSYKPDPSNSGEVSAYNAEAQSLNDEKGRLETERVKLNSERQSLLEWGRRIDSEKEELQNREKTLELRRQDLSNRQEALTKKQDDLKWSREQCTKKTLEWAAMQKESNAKMNELVARLNSLLARIKHFSECPESFPTEVDLTNLNGAAEQASRCLQRAWDGAGAGDTTPVKPKPPFQVTPNQ